MKKLRANELEINVEMVSPIREPKGICVVMNDERDLLDIAQEISGHNRLEVADEYLDGVMVYEGYTKITSMYRRGESVTIVLAKA